MTDPAILEPSGRLIAVACLMVLVAGFILTVLHVLALHRRRILPHGRHGSPAGSCSASAWA